jgi:hypothetical protein
MKQCTKSTAIKPLFLIADAGPDSHPSNEVVIEKGIIPIIAARANSVGNILKTEKGNHFRAKYIPRIYHRLIGKLYNLRTIVERKNSNDVVGYNRSKTLTRGNEWAKIYVSISTLTSIFVGNILNLRALSNSLTFLGTSVIIFFSPKSMFLTFLNFKRMSVGENLLLISALLRAFNILQ